MTPVTSDFERDLELVRDFFSSLIYTVFSLDYLTRTFRKLFKRNKPQPVEIVRYDPLAMLLRRERNSLRPFLAGCGITALIIFVAYVLFRSQQAA